ncbi:MAG: copper resistance protein NlpE N-terminal domain-containing protein [Muribaculaceae bacterium]|nr:copper resistance protein NlpE N-terminal domain-containing protein [Muribaculaceae bacterium]
MKKTIIFAAMCLTMLGMAACSGNGKNANASGADSKKGDKVEVFTGVLPAADADGVRYTLSLEFDDDDNDGDYKLVETFIQADSTAVGGYKDIKNFASEGDFYIKQKDGKTYYELKKDQKDSQPGSLDTPTYFLVDSDSTITMVNAQLELAADSTMNYTLKMTK